MDLCRWLDPFLVARIEFLEWTPDERLRHPRFAGIRSDKDAREVTREDTP
jgi:ATP-dependent DNA ligase